MLKNLRWRLTVFNTAITGAILVGMTLLSLVISEKDTRNMAFQNFSDNVAAVSAYLEGQERIAVSWLRQMENTGRFHITIRDRERSLFSTGLYPEREDLAPEFQYLRTRAREHYRLDVNQSRTGGSCAFPMTGPSGSYFAGLCLIPKEDAMLEVCLLYPQAEMEAGIRGRRVLVCLAEVLALGLLGVFSWVFTGKMLRPIQENQRRQAQFVAAASHELRTPLAAILSAASAMEQSDPDQRARFSGMIRREGDRMTRLMGDMLTLASADSQSWNIHPEALEPDMLLLGVYEAYLPLAREKGLTLELTMPEEDCPRAILDRDRVVQILSILLDNALAYTPAPGRVTLGLEPGKGSLRFTVSDTGPGVPDGEKSRIFERFRRGEKARSNRRHFGLGLCIAAEIVKLHRGKIWVEDATPQGAVFIMELPGR